MATDSIIVSTIVASMVRFAVGMFIFWIYSKNKNILALFTSLFIFSFALHGILRAASIVQGEDALLFLVHRILHTIGPILLLYGISESGIHSIRKYKLIEIAIVMAIVISYYEAYVIGPFESDRSPSFLISPSFAFSGVLFLVCTYYLIHLVKSLPVLGANLILAGLLLQAFLTLSATFIVKIGMADVGFYVGAFTFVLFGLGWWLCLKPRERDVKS